MSKRNKGPADNIKQRFETPIIERGADGIPVLKCPFCKPSHELSTVGVSACGTVLQVRAVQIVHRAKFNKKLVCVKCQQGGGDMVQFNDAFIHTHDCMPGVSTFLETPKLSRMAAFVYKLPGKIKPMFEQRFGEAKAVEEVLPNGTRTGKHLGYFFHKVTQ